MSQRSKPQPKPELTLTKSQTDYHYDGAYIATQLQTVLAYAARQGYVITVETVPLEPLAMGNYRMVCDIRPAK